MKPTSYWYGAAPLVRGVVDSHSVFYNPHEDNTHGVNVLNKPYSTDEEKRSYELVCEIYVV